MLRQEISIIASKLRSEYLNKEEYPDSISFEQAVNLNVEMLEKALQMYNSSLMEREKRILKGR